MELEVVAEHKELRAVVEHTELEMVAADLLGTTVAVKVLGGDALGRTVLVEGVLMEVARDHANSRTFHSVFHWVLS